MLLSQLIKLNTAPSTAAEPRAPKTQKPAEKVRTPTMAARQLAGRVATVQAVPLPMGAVEQRMSGRGTLDLSRLTMLEVSLGDTAWRGTLALDRRPVAEIGLYEDPARSRVEWVPVEGMEWVREVVQGQLDAALASWDPMVTVIAEMMRSGGTARDALDNKLARRRALLGR